MDDTSIRHPWLQPFVKRSTGRVRIAPVCCWMLFSASARDARQDSGLLKKTCSSLVNKNVVLEVMPSQVDYLFESLLTLDEDFPGIYMFMKQRHYEAE